MDLELSLLFIQIILPIENHVPPRTRVDCAVFLAVRIQSSPQLLQQREATWPHAPSITDPPSISPDPTRRSQLPLRITFGWEPRISYSCVVPVLGKPTMFKSAKAS